MSTKRERAVAAVFPKLLINLGDVDPEKHGGFFVLERKDGTHFAVWLQEPDDDQMARADHDESDPGLRWTTRAAELPRHEIDWESVGDSAEVRTVARCLDPSIPVNALIGTASACGQSPVRYLFDLCDADPIVRAKVYQDFCGCYTDAAGFGDERRFSREELYGMFPFLREDG